MVLGARRAAAFGIEIGRVMMQIEKAHRAGMGARKSRHAPPIDAEHLARRMRAFERRKHGCVVGFFPAPVERVDEGFLGFEIAIDRARCDTCHLRDLGHCHAVEAAQFEQLQGRVEQALALVIGFEGFSGQGSHRSLTE